MKRIGTSGLVILLVFGAARHEARAQTPPRGKALYDVMTTERLTTRMGRFRVNWLPDGQGYYVSEKDDDTGQTRFFRVNPQTLVQSPLFDDATEIALRQGYRTLTDEDTDGLPFSQFNYVQDGSAISFTAQKRHFLFDLQTHTLRELIRPDLEPRPAYQSVMGTTHLSASQIWTGTYSPDYTHLAYVKGYDLHVANTETGETKRLTYGGSEQILNGRPDWVYPEELGQKTAFWWSPDGKQIAYLQFDEREVFQYPLVHNLDVEAALELQHYPKAGETNPTVKLFIVDVATGAQVEVATNSSSDVYLLKPRWLHDGSELTFQRLNRHQNHLEVLAADPQTGAVRTILEEREEAFINPRGIFTQRDDFIQLEDGRHFLWTSEQTGWRHLYRYDLQGRRVEQLTSGAWPVESIIHVDEAGGWVYFTGYTEIGLETHFFRVKLDGSQLEPLTTEPGSHSITMDPAGRYYTDSYSSFTTPPTMTLHRTDGTRLHTLMTTNTEKLDALGLEPVEQMTVKAADGVTDLHGLLFKPAGYDPNQSYPLLVAVYGGPFINVISNRYYKTGFEQQLAQLGFMVWKMDNRGTPRRGKAFETETYLKLGQVDLADQAAGVRQITQRPYVDGGRVGIFGGSYGGYMTTLALLKEPDVFHVGVAGAAVTDWRNYNTAYTERYMRTPEENQEGYDLGSALSFAEQLRGKLLLFHGTIDNNVHPGNTAQLIDALVQAGKDFDVMFYPEHRHGIRGPAGRHYGQRRIAYFLEHLDPPAYPWTR